jgi:hypothetical protein
MFCTIVYHEFCFVDKAYSGIVKKFNCYFDIYLIFSFPLCIFLFLYGLLSTNEQSPCFKV